MLVTLLSFIFVFTIIVMIHELGHFLAARFFGVRVDEFAFGFPPRLWSKKVKDTVYAVNLLPLGGYVKLYGENGEATKEKTNLVNKKPWQKGIIFGAGVFMNLLLGWVLLTGFYLVGGKSFIMGMENYKGIQNTQAVYITEVVPGSPAAISGITTGDKIKTVEGTEVTVDAMVIQKISEAKAQGKNEISLVVEKNGQTEPKTLATYKEKIKAGNREVEIDRIGIAVETRGKIKASWYLAPIVAIQEEFRIAEMTVVGFGKFLADIFTKFRLSSDVGGPIAIAQMSGAAARLGAAALLQFVIILTITLGVLNILPFPALDGGHIFFLILEKGIRREISPKVKDTMNQVGFALLLLLIAVITFKDIMRLF